jgi:hypothetical protein
MEPTKEQAIKPGTRCQGLREYVDGEPRVCGGLAVRLVTVRDEAAIDEARSILNEVSNDLNRGRGDVTAQDELDATRMVNIAERGQQVPMCEPCAKWHEEGGK